VIGKSGVDSPLTEEDIEGVIVQGLASMRIQDQRILVVIPDGTRTMPLDLFFRLIVKHLRQREAKTITVLIALGTHPPLSESAKLNLLGITGEQKAGQYPEIQIHNHRWQDPRTLISLGEISAEELSTLSQGRIKEKLEVHINRLVLDNDQILICGPVFPHEVIGFSGGNKYFFPGLAGSNIIDWTHWLGALLTSLAIIGKLDTPVRAVVDRAASLIPTPNRAICVVVRNEGSVAGIYFGTPKEAWRAAAQLSSSLHIHWVEKPCNRILSMIPSKYEDLWTGAKGMYKVEPVVVDGGEVIIYAPHINEISLIHGDFIREVGYHVLDYFLHQWGQFMHIPLAVLAHSTHLKGIGEYSDGIERPRIKVTLATQIPIEICEEINLGYCDPSSIHFEEWADREEEGILMVQKAGEDLYRLIEH
jgi:nickel-dependent lactate racemase